MNWPLFLSTFSLIFIAELPDKTIFATLLMATRGRPLAVFFGVALAFLVQTIIAVSFGSLIGLLPERWVHLGAGIMFIGFAAHSWFQGEEEEKTEGGNTGVVSKRTQFLKTAWKAFVVIFIAEWGDLTQLATASVSAHFHDSLLTVFLAATLALWSATALAIFVGHRVKHVIQPAFLKKMSVVTFVLVGVYFIWTWANSF